MGDCTYTPESQPPGQSTCKIEPAERPHALVRQFRLHVISGPDEGKIGESTGPRLVIGTHEKADLVLQDPTVSRFHCEILLQEGHALVRDLASTNETLIGGVSVMQGRLDPGALLTLGHSRARFELCDGHVKVPLSG